MKIFWSLVAAALWTQGANAGTGEIGPVTIASVGVVGVPFGLHRTGNVEIAIRDGFALPPQVACDNVYITTAKAQDPKRDLLAALLDPPRRPDGRLASLYLTITDAASVRAYPAVPAPVVPRCSLVALRYVFD